MLSSLSLLIADARQTVLMARLNAEAILAIVNSLVHVFLFQNEYL